MTCSIPSKRRPDPQWLLDRLDEQRDRLVGALKLLNDLGLFMRFRHDKMCSREHLDEILTAACENLGVEAGAYAELANQVGTFLPPLPADPGPVELKDALDTQAVRLAKHNELVVFFGLLAQNCPDVIARDEVNDANLAASTRFQTESGEYLRLTRMLSQECSTE